MLNGSEKRQKILIFLVAMLFSLGGFLSCLPAGAVQAESGRYFPETGKTVSGKFLDYWQRNGGLATYGFPITEAQSEVDPETGKVFLIQWFERNRFELHPENAGTRYEVLLGLLGKDLRREALAVDPDFQRSWPLVDPARPRDQQIYFNETGHNLRFGFLRYWQQNGGLERFGFPISEERAELDPETGKIFTMQWFERARFEYHPENAAPYDILLGLLGNQIKTPRTPVEFMWKQGRNPLGLTLPYRVAVDEQGNVFALEPANSITNNSQEPAVWKFSPSGQPLARWGGRGSENGRFNSPLGITVDRQGYVYVTDFLDSNNAGGSRLVPRIQKFDNDGHFVSRFGDTGNLEAPLDISADGQGNLYVLDSYPVERAGDSRRVVKFDSSGKFLGQWTIAKTIPAGQYGDLWALAVDQGGQNFYISDRGNNRVIKFSASGDYIDAWGGRGAAPGLFDYPDKPALDSQGNLYVADRNNHRVQKFDASGKFLLQWGGEGRENGRFRYPTGVAVDRQGRVYAADQENNRVQVFDANGNFLLKISDPSGSDNFTGVTPAGAALDSQDNLFVADSQNNRIMRFAADGRWLGTWGEPGAGDGQFNAPTNLAFDAQDNLYVLDRDNHRVQKLDKTGRFLLKWGNYDLFPLPVALAVDRQGSVYVADRGDPAGGNMRILKFDSSGKLLTQWPIPGINMIAGLAVDQQGYIYAALSLPWRPVTNLGQPRVQKYDGNGKLVTEWGSYGTAEGQFTFLNGIAADRQGNIYVDDQYNHRVQKFTSDGRFLLAFRNSQNTRETLLPVSVPGWSYLAVNSSGTAIYLADPGSQYLMKFKQH